MLERRNLYPNEEPPAGITFTPETFGGRVFFVWGAGLTPALPSNGGHVDGVSGDAGGDGKIRGAWLRLGGVPVKVVAGAAFSAGAELQTNASGQAIAVAGGRVVARALDVSAGAGSLVRVVFV